ncbi:hypothetical protein COV88_00710 [Candidatus Saccharibacteria bacterium CG11_big_fil_rev_8_21_14_0_20_41_19]|nr:hypothetical protein [Candidatus Saccharibacteria bacterium]OIP86184.1 MAG: hypothetical protein AUK57_00185 [Candidatus Saccharibacteria bacterium CG2_30_41_52]PIQ70994.1 MAG: hypothetical protein COV88_00710 [Candidatus Saccharibacteria bacterium CG11_big_fil_rev_8_21_14_0_20_41_19]PIZ60462.1 MAG: hypothetical protein COY18_01245 [Candidatus Saccharibacteria bacterium CG_4_10_14_0_2_um_filter_41_11]PJC29555.1 MAG: hypothetical protein CO052_02660 [Candidatus Saccharibacteria bacterium CG_4
MNYTLILFLAAVIILGAIMLIFANLKSGRHLDVDRYRVKCLSIEQQLKADEPSSYQLAVLNADKLVDQALRERGLKGKTMGERMQCGATLFSDRNGIWTAHKLRNTIAHEPEVQVTYDQARYALSCFRKALKDLGAI